MRCSGSMVMGALSIVLTLGCGDGGPRTYPVSGVVTLDGQPLDQGEIIFHSKSPGVAADAGKIADGKYLFQSKAGAKRVEVRSSRVVPGVKGAMGEDLRREFIPARYNEQSTLEAEVSPGGENKFEFALQSDKK